MKDLPEEEQGLWPFVLPGCIWDVSSEHAFIPNINQLVDCQLSGW